MDASNPPKLSVEQFLLEAGQLHQTWIRRIDAQTRRRPRPPDVETERLRLVRRLQFIQRLQAESLEAEKLGPRLEEFQASPREARLVEGDTTFIEALLVTWQKAQIPQASTIAAGASPPKPTGPVEFRW